MKRKPVCTDRKWNATCIGGLNFNSAEVKCWDNTVGVICAEADDTLENRNSHLARLRFLYKSLKNKTECTWWTQRETAGIYTTDAVSAPDVTPSGPLVECLTHKANKIETFREFQSFHMIGWIRFLGDACVVFFDGPCENKAVMMANQLMKEKAVAFTTVTTGST